MDVSFISVFKILPNLINLLNKETEYIVLIKPQFEAEKSMVESGGVIQNEDTLSKIIQTVEEQFLNLKLNIWASEPSKVKGTKGNQEIFYYVSLNNQTIKQPERT